MNRPYLSVIIPTYNRREQLENCLNALQNQSLAQDSFEVIVVNDGSTDSTRHYLDNLVASWSQLRVLHQDNSGQGIARNRAIQLASGQIILFIGDDIYATDDFLAKHVEFHQDNPEKKYSCLGLTQWDQNQEITPYMHWLTHGGPQFAYHKLNDGEEASFWFFYTSNISLKKELLDKNQFDTDFKGYGWEDIELAYRLTKHEDLIIIFNKNALAYHDHPMNESSLRKRMMGIGSNAKIFQNKHPEIAVRPKGLKNFALHVIGSFPVVFSLQILKTLIPPLARKAYWYSLSKRYFLKGVKSV